VIPESRSGFSLGLLGGQPPCSFIVFKQREVRRKLLSKVVVEAFVTKEIPQSSER
jgi:hypothetical protein